jgi:hypothetical protein
LSEDYALSFRNRRPTISGTNIVYNAPTPAGKSGGNAGNMKTEEEECRKFDSLCLKSHRV